MLKLIARLRKAIDLKVRRFKYQREWALRLRAWNTEWRWDHYKQVYNAYLSAQTLEQSQAGERQLRWLEKVWRVPRKQIKQLRFEARKSCHDTDMKLMYFFMKAGFPANPNG